METKKTIFDYIGQVFLIFGITILVLNVFCILFGDSAKNFSTMFALGSAGLRVQTMLQFFGVAVCIVFLRFLFFTDVIIKKMPIVVRAVSMVTAVVLVIAVFIWAFGWFPVHIWRAWVMFFFCFGVSFAISMVVTTWKERMENRKMEEALARIKQEE